MWQYVSKLFIHIYCNAHYEDMNNIKVISSEEKQYHIAICFSVFYYYFLELCKKYKKMKITQ